MPRRPPILLLVLSIALAAGCGDGSLEKKAPPGPPPAEKAVIENARPRVQTDTSPNGVYSALRAQALAMRRTTVGIPAPPADAPAWGVLMEMGFPEGSATVFALADGTTS